MARLAWIRRKGWPDARSADLRPLSLVDLFCGCGGLTLGVREAARGAERPLDIRLALDCESAPLAVYRDNFGCDDQTALQAPVEELFDGELGAPATVAERRWARRVGRLDVLVAGPPCQGHSDLNNSTRRSDPRCRERGLTFSYHNHDFEFKLRAGDKTFFDALMASTDADYVQSQVDVYWVHFAGLDPAALIRQYAGRCSLIHLKDIPKDFTEMSRPARFAEVGEGQMDMAAIFAASEASGATWYIVEQDQCERPSLESAKLSFDNLKAMGKA